MSSWVTNFVFVLIVLVLLLRDNSYYVYAQEEEAVEEGTVFEFLVSSVNWVVLKSSNGIKFTARNAHATCLYQKKIWVTGGKTDLYQMYNTLYSFKVADVWWSLDGADWVREEELKGDFYAQNSDVLPNWIVAPWYTRFGHTLSPIDIDGDGTDDAMIQLGGFAPLPTNDVWITMDGITQYYCGFAEWSPRGWHSATKYKNQLYIIGGSPLNNEVWRLDSVTQYTRDAPLTRSNYLDISYKTSWTKLTDKASWSPRAGMSIVSQYYYRPQSPFNETIANSTERLVFIGGFGGHLDGDKKYDGYRCRSDVWSSYDGITWTNLLKDGVSSGFTPRAWMSVTVLHKEGDLTRDFALPAAKDNKPPRMWMVGGGYVGDSTFNTKISTAIVGRTDLLFSFDGVKWDRTNYEQGNGVRKYDTFVQYFYNFFLKHKFEFKIGAHLLMKMQEKFRSLLSLYRSIIPPQQKRSHGKQMAI